MRTTCTGIRMNALRKALNVEILWRGSTLNKFLSSVPDAAVQVVPLGEAVS